jgi:uncharacterized protein (DUF433 family)
MLRFDPTPCPLILGADGTIRVRGSGVTLELVAGAFEAGATPEQIAHHCPSLSLATIYSVISHLLDQHAEVQLYLRKRAQPGRASRPAAD